MPFANGQVLTAAELNTLLPMSSTTDASYQLGAGLFLTVLASDVWITTNAHYDGSNWQRVNTALPSLALNFQNFHPIPGETVTYGVLLWSAAAGPNPIGPVTSATGWDLLLALTNFKDFVCGGYGLEMDGNGTTASGYGRVIHNSTGNVPPVRTGILTNLFLDLSNVDAPTAPSWFAGIKDDAFVLERAAPGGTTAAALQPLLSVDAFGDVTTTGNLSVRSAPPPTSTSPGTPGTLTWDSNFLYQCIAPNTWKRTALSSW